MAKKIEFSVNDKKDWGDKQQEISDLLVKGLASGKSFYVEFGMVEEKKRPAQLRAVYKLFQLLLPHLESRFPVGDWNIEKVKEYVKIQLNFVRDPSPLEIALMIKSTGFKPETKEEKAHIRDFCWKMKQPRSFEFFTKDEMIEFINRLEEWARDEGFKDVVLTNEEKENFYKALEKHYGNNKETN